MFFFKIGGMNSKDSPLVLHLPPLVGLLTLLSFQEEQEESLKDLYKHMVKVVAHFDRIVEDHVDNCFRNLTQEVNYGFLRTAACALYTLVQRHLGDVDCDELTSLSETFLTPDDRFYRDYVVVDYAQRLITVANITIDELKTGCLQRSTTV